MTYIPSFIIHRKASIYFENTPSHHALLIALCRRGNVCVRCVCVCGGGLTPAYNTERCIVRRVVMQ